MLISGFSFKNKNSITAPIVFDGHPMTSLITTCLTGTNYVQTRDVEAVGYFFCFRFQLLSSKCFRFHKNLTVSASTSLAQNNFGTIFEIN